MQMFYNKYRYILPVMNESQNHMNSLEEIRIMITEKLTFYRKKLLKKLCHCQKL